MNITLVMSSSITTTLIMAVGPTVGPAVAYSKPVLVRMNVPACGEVAGRRSGRGKAETREHRGEISPLMHACNTAIDSRLFSEPFVWVPEPSRCK